MPTWRGALRRLRGAPPPVPGAERWRGLSRQSPEGVLDLVYELVLAREPDPTGTRSYLEGLRHGTITPQELAGWAVASGEWWSVTPFSGLGQSLHLSRMMFVRSLPPAARSSTSAVPRWATTPARSCSWATRTNSTTSS